MAPLRGWAPQGQPPDRQGSGWPLEDNDAKLRRRPMTRKATGLNRGHHPFAKINGIGSTHRMLASIPASILNQKQTDLGIPNRFRVMSCRSNIARPSGRRSRWHFARIAVRMPDELQVRLHRPARNDLRHISEFEIGLVIADRAGHAVNSAMSRSKARMLSENFA